MVAAALFCAGPLLAQQGGPGTQRKTPRKRRYIYVPYEDLDKVLDKEKHGVVIEFEEYMRLLRKASKEREIKPPADWVIQSSRYSGTVGEEQVKFTGELTFSVLKKGFTKITLPFGAVGITTVKLDGKPANVILARGGYALIMSGKGTHTLSLSFATPLKREKRGKSLGLRIPPAPCTTVTLKVPGKAEVEISPDIFSKTYSPEDDITTVEVFAGGKDFVLAHIAAQEKKSELEPFITSRAQNLLHLDPKTVKVQWFTTVNVYRGEISSLAINVPKDFRVVELACPEMLDWSEKEEGAAKQVILNFREPVKATTTITLSLEKNLPEDMIVKVPVISIAGALTAKPLIQILPSREVAFEVTEAKNLNEITPRGGTATLVNVPSAPQGPRKTVRPARGFEGWPQVYSLVLKVSPVAPVVSSLLTTLVTVERATVSLNSLCTFEVKEGTLYTARLTVPGDWEILSVATNLPQRRYDYTITRAQGPSVIDIVLKEKRSAGAAIQVSVSARMLPKEAHWEQLSIPIPRIVPEGSTLRLGTLVFRAEDSMTLSGADVTGLRDLDVSQIKHRGITVRKTILGYEVKKDDYCGMVIAGRKKPKVSATTVTYLSVNESLFQAVSLLTLRLGESPAREFEFILPPGTGDMVDIRGDFIKEKSLSRQADGDYWKISLQREILGVYNLYIAFDIKVGKDAVELTAPKILVPNPERQDGFVGVEAGEGIEILTTSKELREIPVTAMPYPYALTRYYTPRRVLIHAFRYVATDYSLKLNVTKHALKPVLSVVVPSATYITVFTQDGVQRTRAVFELTSAGNQFFTFRLPEGAQLWSVLLGRDAADLQPAKPAKSGNLVMVSLTAAPKPEPGRENTYVIAATYQRKSQPMTGSGTIEMSLPTVAEGIPVLQSQWRAYLPEQYRYTSFGGDMKLSTRQFSQPLFLEYMWGWLAGICALLVGIACAGQLLLLRRRHAAVYATVAASAVVVAILLALTAFGPHIYRVAHEPPCIVIQRSSGEQEYDETLKRAMFKTPRIESEKMVERPIVILEEEVEITKDIPRGTSFDNLSNKNLTTTPKELALERRVTGLSGEERTPRRPAPQPPGAPVAGKSGYVRGEPSVATQLAEDIRRAKKREKGLLSLSIDLRPQGTPLSFFSLSPGGKLSIGYVNKSRMFAQCLIITLLAFAVAVRLRRKELRIRLTYVLAGIFIFSLLPGAIGAQHAMWCNAAILGITAGALFYGIGALAKYYKQLMAAAVVFLALCLLLLTPQDACAGGGKGEPAEAPDTDTVIIPYDVKTLKEVPGKGRVHIGAKRYEELLRSAGLLPEVTPQPPRLFGVNSAYYEASILSDRIDFTFEMHLELMRAEAAEVFIGLPGIALHNAKLDGKQGSQAAHLRSEASGYFLILTEAGKYKFSTSFSLPIDPKKVSGSVEFPVRPIPCPILKARTSRPGTQIIIKSAVGGQEVNDTKDGREVVAALGPASSVSISYGPKRTVATGAKTATDARLSHYHWLSESLITLRCDARLSVTGGELDSFSFAVPENLEIYQIVTPKEVKVWRIARGPGGGKTLEVLLYEPVKGEFNLTVNGVAVLDRKTGELALPFLQALDARKETGTVCVFLSNTLKADKAGSRNLIQTQSTAKTRENYGVHCAYDYSSRPIELRLKTLEKKADLRADIFTELSVTKDKLFFNTLIELTVAQRGVYNLSLYVPARFDIEDISCYHMKSKHVQKQGNRRLVRIQLVGPLLGSTSISVSGSRIMEQGCSELELPQVVVPGAGFVKGYAVVSSVVGIALTTKETKNLVPVDIRTVPYPRKAAPAHGEKRLAFAFRGREHSGTIGVERLKPSLSANCVSCALVKDEVVSFTTVIEYRIQSAPCRRFSFSMPYALAHKAVLAIPFERQRNLTKVGVGDKARGVWTVELQRGLVDSYSIAINWESISRDDETLVIPSIYPTGVQSRRVYVMLQNSSGLKVTQQEKENLEPASKEEFPLLGAVLVERAIFLCGCKVQDTAKDYRLSFSLKRLKEEKEIEAIIDIAEITTVMSREGYSFNEASYRIQNRAKQYLLLEIPEGAQLWSAEVAGRQVKPALGPGGAGRMVLLPLLKRGKGEFSYAVKVYYGLKLKSKPGFGASFPLKSPRPVGIDVGQTFWTVYAPDEFKYSYDGNMEEVIESAKEVEKAGLYAQEAQRLVRELEETTDIQQREQIAGNIEQFNKLMEQQLKRAQEYQESASQTEVSEGKFKQQFESNVHKLQQAQQQLAMNIKKLQTEKSKLAKKASQQRQKREEGFVAPQAEQAQKASQYLQQAQKRVREQIAKEEKARRDITEMDRLSNKNLDSTSCIDAYGIGGGRAGAYGQRWGKGSLAREGGSPGTESTVSASLRWLHFHQDSDGHWDQDGFDKNCDRRKSVICDGRGTSQYDVAVTSLALLAFMGNGHTHRVGQFRKTVRRGLDWLIGQQHADGSFGPRLAESWIYNHAIGTMAICEAYAVTRDYRLKIVAQKAVDYIRAAQNSGLGWKYEAQDGRNDSSVTGWMVMALKAAKTAGLHVDRSMFDGAINWFDRATNTAGKCGYMRPGDDGSVIRGVNEHYAKLPTMTAVSVICRIFCGQSRSNPKVLKGVDILMANLPDYNKPRNDKVDFYYWYYGTYAMFQFGGQNWHKWNSAMKKALLDTQRVGGCADGSWDPVGKWGMIGGRVYATAINSLTLEIYYRYARAHPGRRMPRDMWRAEDLARDGLVDHGARAAGIMPPEIYLPKVGRTLSFKKLGTDPVLVLGSTDSQSYERIYAFLKLVSLLLLLALAFALKLSFFGDKDLRERLGEGVVLTVAVFLCVLTVWAAIVLACIAVAGLVLTKTGRAGLILRH